MEQIPIDYTGYGPTGTGYRPTASMMRRQSENKYRTDRNAQAMQYVDPSMQAAAGLAMQGFSKTNDPTKARELMYNSAGGQLALDLAFAARRNGVLGSGDPVNYSHNLTRGITSGGFKMDIVGKDAAGRSSLGLNQRVQGNGLIAERVTQKFQKGLLDELYGKDAAADPNKLSGFDMEEASGVASTIMRRGGVGKAATMVLGADAQTRVNAARDAAVDPGVKAKLAGVNVGSQKELEQLAKSVDADKDPKFKKELERLAKSTDAIVTNDGAHKRVAGVVREVTKGMAALADMYGELSAPELHQQLESITGKQITNKQQAKAATRMVENLRNGAEAAGLDPRAFMDYAQQSQAEFGMGYEQAAGRDGRTGTSSKAVSAKLHNQIMQDAVAGAKTSQDVAAAGKELGIEGMEDTVQNADELALDMKQQTLQSIERSKGEAMVRGRISEIDNPEERKAAEALLARQANTTDAGERSNNEEQLKAIAARKWGGDAGTFEAAAATRAGRLGMDRGNTDAVQVESQRKTSLAALNTATIDNVGTDLMGMGGTEAKEFSTMLMDKLGGKGMVDVAAIAKGPDQIGDQKITAKDRKAQIHAYLTKDAQMSEDQARAYESKMLNDEGRFKDEETAKKLTKRVTETSWGDKSAAQRTAEVNDSLSQRGDKGMRKKIGEDGNGKVTVSGIVNAMISKRIGGAEDPETMALTLAAMKEDGMKSMTTDEIDSEGNKVVVKGEDGKTTTKKINVMDGVDTGIDMSKNISEDAVNRLTKVNGGKDLGLLKKFGYKDNAEMAEKTKDPFERKKVLDYLDESTDLNLTGDLAHTTAISDTALSSARDAKNGPATLMRMEAGARLLNKGMKEGEDSAITTAIKSGEMKNVDAAVAGEYKADQVGKRSSTKWHGGGRQFTHMANNRKFVDAAQDINAADEDEMKNIGELNKDGSFGKSMEAQLASLKQAKAGGMDTVIARGADGKEVTNNVDDSIAKLESAIAKLAAASLAGKGGQSVGEMVVTKMTVVNYDDHKKT